jgi:hypothetical protein
MCHHMQMEDMRCVCAVVGVRLWVDKPVLPVLLVKVNGRLTAASCCLSVAELVWPNMQGYLEEMLLGHW